MFQCKGGNTVFKGHVTVGVGDGSVTQRYREMELLCGISVVTGHRFGNRQAPCCRLRFGFRRMGVGDGKACGIIPGDGSFIAVHLNFLDGIEDLISFIVVLIQPLECTLPAVLFAKCQRLPFAPINQQFYSDTFRVFAILLVIVVPNLFH